MCFRPDNDGGLQRGASIGEVDRHLFVPERFNEVSALSDIKVEGARVSGRAFDGSMEEAAVSGTVTAERYELLLHPLKHGTSSEQDVHYRARRAEDALAGEWEHVVGAKGPWTATITDLAANEALKLHAPPCKPTTVTHKPTIDCDKDA